MEDDASKKRSQLSRSLTTFTKFCLNAGITLGVLGAMYALWSFSGGSSGGQTAILGIAEGFVFVICVWIGFIIGYFASRPRRNSDSR
jgi:hypothetical protein